MSGSGSKNWRRRERRREHRRETQTSEMLFRRLMTGGLNPVFDKLREGLVYGCPAGSIEGPGRAGLPGLPGSPWLLDKLVCGVIDGLTKQESFTQWFVEEYQSHGGGFDVQGLALVVFNWLRFAHLDCVANVPSWWVFAWAGFPVSDALVDTLNKSVYSLAVDLVSLSTSPARVAEWPCVVELQTKGVQTTRRMLEEVRKWVRDTGADVGSCREWFLHHRDADFEKLEAWLYGGWEEEKGGRCPGSFGYLYELRPVPLSTVMDMETDLGGVRLPADLRRLLLEIGDVGHAVIGRDLTNSFLFAGEWPYTDSSEVNGNVSFGTRVWVCEGGGRVIRL